MPLALRSDLKTRLGITDTGSDSKCDAALDVATRMIESYCDRTLLYAASDRSEQFDGDELRVRVEAWPITTLTSVKESGNYDFSSASGLIENTDFVANMARGWLERLPRAKRWMTGTRVVQVVYRGGYNDPSAAPISGVDYVPQGIQQACLLQAIEMYNRMKDPGYKSVFTTGGISGGYGPETAVLPAVAELLAGERRF